MAADVLKQVTSFQMSLTGADSVAFLGGVKKLILQAATNDCYIDIDQPTAPTTSFRVFASNTSPTVIEMDMGLMTNLHARSVTGSATLYVMSIVG